MPEILDGTDIKLKPIVSLARCLSNDRESFLQLLLEFSTKATFNRIVRCPTYPVRIETQDLEYRKSLLKDSVAQNQYEISFALAFLYNWVTEKSVRKKCGQFFTPMCVAERALAKITLTPGETLIDPGCGTGIFPLTLLKSTAHCAINSATFSYLGIENSSLLALCAAVSLEWVGAPQHWRILFANYLGVTVDDIQEIIGRGKKIDAIISNPPYVRCHRLGERSKLTNELNLLGYSGLHSFFLGHSSRLLENGKMLFLVPIEMNGTRYGSSQLEKLESRYRQENEVMFFDETAKLWKSVISHDIPLSLHTKIKRLWNLLQFTPIAEGSQKERTLCHSKDVGGENLLLGSFAKVHRGISTGANDFFVINESLAGETGIDEETGFLTRIIPTKIPKSQLEPIFEAEDWEAHKKTGSPCWILTISPFAELSSEVKNYLRKGESLGIHLTSTSKSRKIWYCIKIPKRPPDLFFTYISRGFPLFIYNQAKIHNLTNLLGIYLETVTVASEQEKQQLVNLLNESLEKWFSKETVGRRYKGGIVKLEPSDLERMPVPISALKTLKGFKSISQ